MNENFEQSGSPIEKPAAHSEGFTYSPEEIAAAAELLEISPDASDQEWAKAWDTLEDQQFKSGGTAIDLVPGSYIRFATFMQTKGVNTDEKYIPRAA